MRSESGSEIMSVLRDILEVARLATSNVTRADLAPPWGLQIDPSMDLAVHVVQRGRCWLQTEGGERAFPMEEGDVALIRHGVAHAVTDGPETSALPYKEGLDIATDRARTLPIGQRDGVTRILCAKYSFEQGSAHPLLEHLPPICVVKAESVEKSRSLHLLLQTLEAEGEGGMGSDLLLPRLVDSLLILVLRAWIAEQKSESMGWAGALRDPAVARALQCLHERPHEPWTVESLAKTVGQSRATLHRRFVDLVGEPPASYLGQWRMSLAAHLLRQTELPLAEVAQRVGYESAAALSKAFRRTHGLAPGRYRADGDGKVSASDNRLSKADEAWALHDL